MANMVVKDDDLRDNPPSTQSDGLVARLLGQRWVHNGNRPRCTTSSRWRQLTDACEPPRVLVGETVVHAIADLARFYGNGSDELHLALNVPFHEAPYEASALQAVVEETESLLPP